RYPARVLAVRARFPVHRGHAVPARWRGRAVAQAACPLRRACGYRCTRRSGIAAAVCRDGTTCHQGSPRMNTFMRQSPPPEWPPEGVADESASRAHVVKPGELDLSHKVILYLE